MPLHGKNMSFLDPFEGDLINFITASEVDLLRARDWADFWVLRHSRGHMADGFLEGFRECWLEAPVIALNPSWMPIVRVRVIRIESFWGFLTEGRVETFMLWIDILDAALSGGIGESEPCGSRYNFYWGYITWLELFWGLIKESTLMNSRRFGGTHFAPVISSWNSPLGIFWGAQKEVACWR
jgi:hypothetical protein